MLKYLDLPVINLSYITRTYTINLHPVVSSKSGIIFTADSAEFDKHEDGVDSPMNKWMGMPYKGIKYH